jgi:hypothetical protein
MIRQFVAAAALAGLFLVGGCNDSGSGGDASAGGGATTPSTPSPSVADNTKKVCADIEALSTEFTQKVVMLAARAIQELAAGDEAKADKTMAEVNALLPEYAGKIEALGATASNTELKQVLTTLAADVRKANEDTVEDVMTNAETKYNAICGK